MKTTYLIYKQVDGVRQLVVATQEEWTLFEGKQDVFAFVRTPPFYEGLFRGRG